MKKKLIEVCNPKQYKTIATKDLLEEGYQVYGANGKIGFYDKYTHEKETLMITCRGATCGTLNISEPYSYINGNAMALDNLSEDINLKYLYYYLENRKLLDTISGSAQPQITRASLEKVIIEYPNIETQHKIVEVLDKAQALIDKRTEQIVLLDELIQSKFIDMFGNPITNLKGWATSLLGEICDLKAGKNIKANEIYEEQTEGLYPCYGGNGLRGYVDRYSHEGNINLIGRQGALCGNVKYARGKFYATEHAVVTQPKIDINSYWLHFVLTELDLNRLSSGAAQPGLTVGALNKVEIIQPPITLQNKFADFVEKIDSIRALLNKSLKQLQDNFDSLQQRAFKGELF